MTEDDFGKFQLGNIRKQIKIFLTFSSLRSKRLLEIASCDSRCSPCASRKHAAVLLPTSLPCGPNGLRHLDDNRVGSSSTAHLL